MYFGTKGIDRKTVTEATINCIRVYRQKIIKKTLQKFFVELFVFVDVIQINSYLKFKDLSHYLHFTIKYFDI